ncbi:CTAG/Pcc1 family [Entophlyctis helioformis]|nr:CTAG/Pcc1 family [Entophlyctis helioformis]
MAHELTIRIPFGDVQFATYAQQALAVDKELRPSQVSKALTVDGDTLVVTFHAVSVRMLRTSVSSFLEFANLAARTLAEFGESI